MSILITHSDNTVKLIDFGLSDDDAHYLSKTPGFTPEYASPELLAHSAPLDARSDIYSLGLLMRDIFGGKYRYIYQSSPSSFSQNWKLYQSFLKVGFQTKSGISTMDY